MAVIEVNNLTKEYRLGALSTLKDSATNLLKKTQGKPVAERKQFKALDNINFKIEKGEVVGLIGTNGAGKSTLLKHLAHITTPTSGEVIVNGTVAPLIEVGAGFVPDLTGRENIYLNGSIMGLKRKQIDEKIDEIIDFAEIEEFIDTPVKRYSSGMAVRLGFAVATSIDADILIVDEVLAVGDLAFQRKCFERMENLIKRQNKTVFLVSHNIRQIERLCSRALLLDHGRILSDASPGDVTELFYKRSNEKIQQRQLAVSQKHLATKGSGEMELLDIAILNNEGNPVEEISSNTPLTIRVKFELKTDFDKPELVVGTHRTDFVYLSSSSTALIEDRPSFKAGIHTVDYCVEHFPLIPGVYCVRVAFFDANGRQVFHGETLKTFSLTGERKRAGSRTLELPTEWRIEGNKYHV